MDSLKNFLKQHNIDNFTDKSKFPIIIGIVAIIISFGNLCIPLIGFSFVKIIILIIKIIISVIGLIIGIISIRIGILGRKKSDNIQALAPLVLGIVSVIMSAYIFLSSIMLLIGLIILATA